MTVWAALAALDPALPARRSSADPTLPDMLLTLTGFAGGVPALAAAARAADTCVFMTAAAALKLAAGTDTRCCSSTDVAVLCTASSPDWLPAAANAFNTSRVDRSGRSSSS